MPFVVVVEESDPLAAGRADAGVARRRAAAGDGEENRAQARIGKGFKLRLGNRIGTVDHDNDFDPRPGLEQGAAHGAGEQSRTAVGGNDGRNQRGNRR
jgi:hypothetical protein